MAGSTQLAPPRPSLQRAWRIALLAALACVAALLSGCLTLQRAPDGTLSLTTASPDAIADKNAAKAANTKSEPSETSQPSQPHPDEKAPAEIGTPFTTGSWQVTVTSVKPHKRMPNGQKPNKGNILIYVNVKVLNVGSTTDLTVKPTQFWLTDSADKKVKPFKTDLVAFNAQQVRPVQIAMGGHTTFVYEIPKKSTGYVFHFKKRKTSPTIYHWQVR